MADNASLLIVLEASSRKLQRQLVESTKTIDRFADQTNRRFDAMNQKNAASFETLQRKAGLSIRSIGAAFASIGALRGASALIDANTNIRNSLKVAGLAGEELNTVYGALFESAQRNSAPVASLAELYGKAALAQKELGVSSADLIKFTDNVALGLRVSGKSATESSGALLQLGQALGSGTVHAEEFNSILEGAPAIAQAAAAGLTEAGGSVAKLRALVITGKISSEAFFAAIQAGSVTLEGKLAGAESTVSQAFVRLQNVLIDVAGRFNDATGASGDFASFLDQVGAAIGRLSDNEDFKRFLSSVNDFGNKEFSNTTREFEQVGAAIAAVRSYLDDLSNSVDFTAAQAETAQQSIDAFAVANAGVFSPEVAAAFDDLVGQLAAGRGNAETATAAIMAIGAADPSFDKVIGKVSVLISNFLELRDAATAALLATDSSKVTVATPQSYAGQDGGAPRRSSVKTVSLSDYKAPVGTGGGGAGNSAGEKFSDRLDKQRAENRLLVERTALQATLNPLLNDYGAAQAELTTRQELLTAAQEAGIAITPELRANIDTLATGYANATVEAAKLAEAQDLAKQAMTDWFDLGKSATRGFIDDLIEGKSAAEALGNVFNKLGDKLLDMGLTALFGGGPGGGFGAVGKLFGFAKGGIAANGKPKMFANGGVSNSASVFGEAGPEAAVPLPDGRRIPVDLRMPANDNRAASNTTVPISIQIDATGADAAGLARVEQKVAELKASLPGVIKQTVGRRAKDIW
jgi:tape measure domain-containing protein